MEGLDNLSKFRQNLHQLLHDDSGGGKGDGKVVKETKERIVVDNNKNKGRNKTNYGENSNDLLNEIDDLNVKLVDYKIKYKNNHTRLLDLDKEYKKKMGVLVKENQQLKVQLEAANNNIASLKDTLNLKQSRIKALVVELDKCLNRQVEPNSPQNESDNEGCLVDSDTDAINLDTRQLLYLNLQNLTIDDDNTTKFEDGNITSMDYNASQGSIYNSNPVPDLDCRPCSSYTDEDIVESTEILLNI